MTNEETVKDVVIRERVEQFKAYRDFTPAVVSIFIVAEYHGITYEKLFKGDYGVIFEVKKYREKLVAGILLAEGREEIKKLLEDLLGK